MNSRAPGLCTVDFGIDATSSAKRLQEEYTGRVGGERSGVIRSEDDLLVHGSRRWRRKGGGVGGLEVRGGWEAVVHGWVARGVHQYRARPGHTGGTGMALHNLDSGLITVQVKPTFRDFSRKIQKKACNALWKYFPT